MAAFAYDPFLSEAELALVAQDATFAPFVVEARKRLKAAFAPEKRVAGTPEHQVGYAPAHAPVPAAPAELPAAPAVRRLGYL